MLKTLHTLFPEQFNCRFFEHFREGIASWSSLLQRRDLKQKIKIMGELNTSSLFPEPFSFKNIH